MTKFAIVLDEDNAYWTTSVIGPSGVTHNYTFDINDAALFPDRISAFALMNTVGLDPAEHTLHDIYIGYAVSPLDKFM